MLIMVSSLVGNDDRSQVPKYLWPWALLCEPLIGLRPTKVESSIINRLRTLHGV